MYSPKIDEELIRVMYRIKKKTGKPIAKQANEAIEEYVSRVKRNKESYLEQEEEGNG